MVGVRALVIDDLLERNGITKDFFMNETYKCMLVSIFETIVSEMTDNNVKKEIKNRYLNSTNKIITTQRIVYEKTRCKLNDEESKILYEYLYAYFTKNNLRKNYDDSVRYSLLNKQNGKCNICNHCIDISIAELDHIIPWTMVGDELGINNLQMLCKDCNRRKSKNSAYNLKMFLVNKC